jgi:hypothetical protein
MKARDFIKRKPYFNVMTGETKCMNEEKRLKLKDADDWMPSSNFYGQKLNPTLKDVPLIYIGPDHEKIYARCLCLDEINFYLLNNKKLLVIKHKESYSVIKGVTLKEILNYFNQPVKRSAALSHGKSIRAKREKNRLRNEPEVRLQQDTRIFEETEQDSIQAEGHVPLLLPPLDESDWNPQRKDFGTRGREFRHSKEICPQIALKELIIKQKMMMFMPAEKEAEEPAAKRFKPGNTM